MEVDCLICTRKTIMVTESPQGPSVPRWSDADLPVPTGEARLPVDESPPLSASEVLHDLSNALAAIVTMTDVLIDELGQGGVAVGHLRIMRTSAGDGFDSCQQLRRSLRDSGRLDRAHVPAGRGAFDAIHVSRLVQEMTAVLQSVTVAKARIHFVLQDDLPAVRGSASQLRQVLMNLVINAAQAQTGSDGNIQVATGLLPPSLVDAERPHVMAGQLHPIPYACLQVTDSGCGVAPEVKQRMFESQFTTKQSGRGEGLSSVRKIVQSHGGAVTVRDVAEGGTAVRLLLPAMIGDVPRH